MRSSRPPDSSSKRVKLASGSSGGIAKDYTPPTARLADIGGVEACVEKMLELVAMPLCHPEIYLHTGVQPPRGVLLHGPPGCGKTLLANAMAGVIIFEYCYLACVKKIILQELGVPFINISAPSIVSGMSGESEKTLRDTFEEAKVHTSFTIFLFRPDLYCNSARRSMSFIHRRDRRYHPKTRECATRDGEKDCGTVSNLHGWYNFCYLWFPPRLTFV